MQGIGVMVKALEATALRYQQEIKNLVLILSKTVGLQWQNNTGTV